MKKSILSIGLVLVFTSVNAQFVVDAPALEAQGFKQLANDIKSLEEASSQTKQLTRTTQLLKEAKNLLEKVNQTVAQSESAKNIIHKTSKIGVNINDMYNLVREKEYGNSQYMIKSALDIINDISIKTERNTSEFNKIITSGFFKMNDAERLSLLKGIEEKVDALLYYTITVQRNLNKTL